MKVFLATDHAGYKLKEEVKNFLIDLGYDVMDCGAYTYDPEDDYPDFISLAAKGVSEDLSAKAIIFGGSGQAEAIAANKYPNVRAVVFYSAQAPIGEADIQGRKSDDPYEMIRLTREHNDANILSLGARFISTPQAKEVIKLWLETLFSNSPRHQRRIDKIMKLEKYV